MDFKEIKQIRLQVGRGEDSFPMQDGSFSYLEKVLWKKELQTKILDETDTRLYLGFYDENDIQEGTAVAERKGVTGKKDRLIEWKMSFSDDKINRYYLTLPAEKKEHYYGCGETFSKLDLRGERVRIWVAEHQNDSRIRKKLEGGLKELPFSEDESYYAQPTFVSSNHYFVHVDGTAYVEFDFRSADKIGIELRENARILIGNACCFEKLSEKLAGVVGTQKELPDWVYDGVILGIQKGNDAIDKKIEKVRNAGGKVAGVWSQDWCGCRETEFGYRVRWNWEWEPSIYPQLPEKIKEWNADGIRFLGYINPFLISGESLYKEALKKGYYVKNKKSEPYLVYSGSFEAILVDFTNPEAYVWYKNIIKKNMIGIGLSGWMADFGEYLPTDCVLYSGEDPKLVHNIWPAIWAKMNREAIAEEGKENEIFFFTRAGYTDTIKYSTMMWNGDQHVDWSFDEGFASVIPAALSLSMSGFGISHSDIGGYTTMQNMTRSKELLMRWEEVNVFSPLMRSHEGNQPSRSVQFDADEELLKHLGKMIKMHVILKPYLKDTVKQVQMHGTPVMRPLFFHYEEERAFEEAYEYLLGRDILVAPVLMEGEEVKECYLPKDHWIHIFSGQEYEGGIITVNAPIGKPPIFIRSDSEWREYILEQFSQF